MKDFEELKKEAAIYIRYEKDEANKIAWLTFDRPDMLNATTIGTPALCANCMAVPNTLWHRPMVWISVAAFMAQQSIAMGFV